MSSRMLLCAASTLVFTASMAAAQGDGSYNVRYNDIGLELNQVGGYGQLIVSPDGFADMSYGTCQVNFTRDEAGNPKDYTSVVQGSSAKCPDALEFSVSDGEDGMAQITFTKGGALEGKTLDLFPTMRPMSDAYKVTAPQGFDIMGMTIGQTRAEIEAILNEKGYKELENYRDTSEYSTGHSRRLELWGRGKQPNNDRPADMISVTYTPILKGETEKVEYLSRHWSLNESDNLSLANLRKSLDDKHGKTTSNFESRYYDRSGALVPEAFQQSCDPKVHLQSVGSNYQFVGEGGDVTLSPSCGAQVTVMTLEDYNAPGRANLLKLSLGKGDVAYEAYWNIWAMDQEKALKAAYELQANMTGAAPEL